MKTITSRSIRSESLRSAGDQRDLGRSRWLLSPVLVGALSGIPTESRSGSAHSISPCLRLTVNSEASVRPAATRRHRAIPERPLLQLLCGLRPIEPLPDRRLVVGRPV